jgi:hypothetical protein
MSWEAFLAVALPIVLGGIGYLLKTAVDNSASHIGAVSESNRRIAEELRRNTVAFAQGIDTDLRNRRLEVYKVLWALTAALPQYPARAPLTVAGLLAFSEKLRDWYFETGGIFLSTDARDAYFEVQKSVRAVLDTGASGQVDDATYDGIRTRCSRLRTELAEDLFSRRAAPDLP